ncbi:hypothetical protein DENSPDRAFT_844943 [Dentipellis sp. KUC8613]|nr:hypothetical protein DENSPDRAFT_844943 [Dentipellis sp. KUC8613]
MALSSANPLSLDLNPASHCAPPMRRTTSASSVQSRRTSGSWSEWSYGDSEPSASQATADEQRASPMPSLDALISFPTTSASPSPPPCASAAPESLSAPSEPDAEDAWNLVPYNISWGPEYEDYRAGVLPGPHGERCIFLRSPTPLQKQRAAEACQRCRERKAKCTGTRPSCARCTARGYACHYTSDTRSTRPAKPRRRQKRERENEPKTPREPVLSSSHPHPYIAAKDVGLLSDEPMRLVTDVADDLRLPTLALDYPGTSTSTSTSPSSTAWDTSTTPSDEYPLDEPWHFAPTPADEYAVFAHHPSASHPHAHPHDFGAYAYAFGADDLAHAPETSILQQQALFAAAPRFATGDRDRDGLSSGGGVADRDRDQDVDMGLGFGVGVGVGMGPLCLQPAPPSRRAASAHGAGADADAFFPAVSDATACASMDSYSSHAHATTAAAASEEHDGAAAAAYFSVPVHELHAFARAHYSDAPAAADHAYSIYTSCT